MPDLSLGQLLVQGWPVMLAAPGIALALLAIGAVAGWCAKAHIVKILARTLAEKVEIADRHRAYAESRVVDISVKHQTVLAASEGLKADVLRLTEQVKVGVYSPELAILSASATKKLETLATANTALTSSISTLTLGVGGVNDYLWIDGNTNRPATPLRGTTNPPAASPPSQEPPTSPIRR
jgi:cell division protein FtsB